MYYSWDETGMEPSYEDGGFVDRAEHEDVLKELSNLEAHCEDLEERLNRILDIINY